MVSAPRYNLATMLPWASGTKLGPYEMVVAPIGTGGMGEVWKWGTTGLFRRRDVPAEADRESVRPEVLPMSSE
jgi:hypothetical protein